MIVASRTDGPVKTAGRDLAGIGNNKLMVHVMSGTVDSHGNALLGQPVDIAAFVFRFIVIRNNTNLDTPLMRFQQRLTNAIIRYCKHTNLQRLMRTIDQS